MKSAAFGVLVVACGALGLVQACSDDEGEAAATTAAAATTGSPDNAGAVCEVAADCYADLGDAGTIQGEVECLDRVRGGYCTHTCEADDDCCAVEGECKTELAQVCSPFESTDDKRCFLSCEPEDVGEEDEQVFCQLEASADFICRSSGGGGDNRKVCVPGDCGVGAACVDDADCDADLACITELDGGYCGARDCVNDAGCPQGSLCVTRTSGTNVCLRPCLVESDCSFCRPEADAGTCTGAVTFVEPPPDGFTVCVPQGF